MHHAVASVLALLLATVLVDPSCGSTYGRLVNITVDDQATDPTTGQSLIVYSNHFAAGQDCGSDCASRPNPSQAFDETWHDVTYDPGRDDYHNIPQTATFQFNGSAIRAYGIQSQSKTNPYSDAHILFFIDGDNVANYTYIAPGLVGVYTYNQLLFFSGPLEYGSHTLRVRGLSRARCSDKILAISRLLKLRRARGLAGPQVRAQIPGNQLPHRDRRRAMCMASAPQRGQQSSSQ